MTTPTPNPPYQPWPPQPTPPAVPPKRKSRVGLVIGLIAGVAILLIAGVIAIGVAAGGTKSSAKPGVVTPTEFHGAPPAAATDPCKDFGLCPTEAAAAAGPVLTADQVKLTLKTTEKACFGSAGCNVTVKVQMAYDGEPLDSGTTWEVTYEITGGDDGPQIGSFDVTGSQYDVNTELLSTKSKTTKLHVKVTDVDKLGI